MSTGDALQMPPTCQVFTYGSDLCIQALVVDQTRLLLNHALSLTTCAADELLTEASACSRPASRAFMGLAKLQKPTI